MSSNNPDFYTIIRQQLDEISSALMEWSGDDSLVCMEYSPYYIYVSLANMIETNLVKYDTFGDISEQPRSFNQVFIKHVSPKTIRTIKQLTRLLTIQFT